MFVPKALAAAFLALLPAGAMAAAPPPANTSFFPQTNHSVSFGFKHFFDTRGSLDNFGYPTTDEIQENGWTVQYFQRARFEYHPEFGGSPYEVELGLLGDLTSGQTFDKAQPQAGARYYSETSHNLSGPFQKFFDARGGLDIFGYPTSETFLRGGFTVQYFQRARFELHGTDVQLGLLGDEYLAQRAAAAAPPAQPPATTPGDLSASIPSSSSSPAPTLPSASGLTAPAQLPLLVASPLQPAPLIRVGVLSVGTPSGAGSSGAAINVAGSGSFNVVDNSGRQLLSAGAGQTINVTWANATYTVKNGGQSVSSSLPVRFVPAGDTILTGTDLPAYAHDFRGVLEANYSAKSSKLWLIDELQLEDYVKGIGEESEGLPAEAYKTFAVAYRSYALSTLQRHKADPSWGEPFDLGSSTDWVQPYTGANQIFSGYHRETLGPMLSNGQQATAGQVVTYNGQLVVTPYFSHSDGHTRSWADVWHGSDHPWLISVADPDSNGESLLGHGVGMPLQSVSRRASAG
ncbi:MAG: hypothetical protein JOZ39_12525, partial [Chloroflexi bacterium]|nr:hypothetical protein [Chloroflexota bacterium]